MVSETPKDDAPGMGGGDIGGMGGMGGMAAWVCNYPPLVTRAVNPQGLGPCGFFYVCSSRLNTFVEAL